MKKTKLIINATSVQSGGAKKRLLEFIARADKDDNYDLYLLKNSLIKINVCNAKVISLPNYNLPFFRLACDFIVVPFLYFLGFKKIYIFGNFFISLYPGRILWNLTNIEPFVHKDYGVSYTGWQKWRLFFLRILFALSRKPNILVAQSRYTKNLLQKKNICNVAHIYNGVNTLPYKIIRDTVRINNKPVYDVIFLGQIVRYKRLDQLLVYLSKTGLINSIKLKIVGKLTWDKEHVEELYQLIKDLGIYKAVTFYGEVPHEQAIDLLSSSDALIYTNAYDNCPNVVLEAMSFKVPVLALENEVVKELGEKYGGVTIFDFDTNPKEFLSKIKTPAYSTYNFTWDDHYMGITRLIEQL